jgi:uncharacterized repeat protein (TIGR01451 family)
VVLIVITIQVLPSFSRVEADWLAVGPGAAANQIASLHPSREVINVEPEAVDDAYSVIANGTFQVDAPGVLDNDSDLDGDPLTAAVLMTDVASGTLEFDASGAFTYTPPVDYWGVVTFTYLVTNNLTLIPTANFGDSAFDTFGGGHSTDVDLGDLDGDGDMDVLITNEENGTQKVWLNQGGAQAGTPGDFGSSAFNSFDNGDSMGSDIGDLDGDGDLDVLISDYTGSENVWLNQGGAQGGTPADFGTTAFDSFGGWYSSNVKLGDLDGDGDLDAVVSGFIEGTQKVWINQGGAQGGISGDFGTSPIDEFGGQPLWAAGVDLGDVDGDGDLDAVFGNYIGTNEVWLNQDGAQGGTPGDLSRGDTFGSHDNWNVELGDVDGDGDPDILVAKSDADSQVWLNQGGSQGGTPGDFGAGAFDAFGARYSLDADLGDLDGDGDLDAVITVWSGANEVWLNQGGVQGGTYGDFGSGAFYTFGNGSNCRAADLGDVDEDGDLDVVFARNSGAQEVWLNKEVRTWDSSNIATVTITVQAVDLGIIKAVTGPTTGFGQAIEAARGDAITYTLTFSNVGNGIATGVIISDTIPLSVTLTSASTTVPITERAGSRYVWDVVDLGPGAAGIITVTGVLSAPLLLGSSFTNTAAITSTVLDTDSTNHTGVAAITVVNAPPMAKDDAPSLEEDSMGNVLNVIENDSDADNDSLTISSLGTPDRGGRVLSNGTYISYTPAADFYGTEVFTYTVTDGFAGFDTATVTVFVTSVNDAPVARAGPDQFVDAGVLVTLDGTASSDPEGSPLNYDWTQMGGPTANLSGRMTATPTFTAAVTHTVMTFTLIVTDIQGLASEVDDIVVKVNVLKLYLPLVLVQE